MTRSELARLARTVRRLHPLQIATRVPHLAVARALSFMPGAAAPTPIERFPAPPRALVDLAQAERSRGAKRLAHLPPGRLRDYEEAYGLALGADAAPVDVSAWQRRVALEPYPASVRARRLAVAMRCGGPGRAVGMASELARACRAVLLQPELHLMANHLLENGIALAAAGAVTRGPEARAWSRAGTAILSWQLPEQFLPDGGHFERSATYHLALTYGLLELIELTMATGASVPELWRDTARRACAWLSQVRAPDATYPLLNDAALDAAPSLDDVLRLGRALGLAAPAAERPPDGIVHLRDTGWVLFRLGHDMLVFDAGPEGARYQPGHVHADALTFELWIHGARTVADYGVSSYANDEARRTCRATRVHNTVELGEQDSSEVWSAFRVGRPANAEVHEVIDRTGIDGGADGAGADGRVLIATASHDGYAFMSGHPIHRRRITLRPRRLTVEDTLERSATPRSAPLSAPLSALSRLRVADNEVRGLVVRGGAGSRVSRDVWFPEHGAPREALVYQQAGRLEQRLEMNWELTWEAGPGPGGRPER
ncbi:MAG: alginate lyase family protein [Myxococcales bacterium]|nr:alginate lyase family protein [Myxococcales bacterium]